MSSEETVYEEIRISQPITTSMLIKNTGLKSRKVYKALVDLQSNEAIIGQKINRQWKWSVTGTRVPIGFGNYTLGA